MKLWPCQRYVERGNFTCMIMKNSNNQNISLKFQKISLVGFKEIVTFDTRSLKGASLSADNAGYIEIKPYLRESSIRVIAANHKITVKFLPPVVIEFILPEDYPSDQPPKFDVSASWMSQEQVVLLICCIFRIILLTKCLSLS